MTKRILISLGAVSLFLLTTAFCGFYVAKVDAQLLNRTSQVILARSGQQTVVTMASDFEGDVKDFAMVVPIPEVPGRDQIRLADAAIFSKLDAYSGPRLVKYIDDEPCEASIDFEGMGMTANAAAAPKSEATPEPNGVEIVAKYAIGEYDILVLSAKESQGLKTWLNQNGYKIPDGANEVLDPYIKNNMKFFVVKVNLDEYKKSGEEDLRPIQLSYTSDKFMLPIRLGMANADGEQDLIVYAFSDKGQIECTNYRTVDIPTNRDVPVFVQDQFQSFYEALFTKSWDAAGKNVVFKEYSWDLNSDNFVHCDPCTTDPPLMADLKEAGIFWLAGATPTGSRTSDYEGDLHITRMHLRYDRENFPQDLVFQATPNKDNFQGRYVMHIPAKGGMDCDAAKDYLTKLSLRRESELKGLNQLTGWSTDEFAAYVSAARNGSPDGYKPGDLSKLSFNGAVAKAPEKQDDKTGPWGLALLGLAALGGGYLAFRALRGNAA
ncbi:MAG: DUF2330 domain-containing protein [Bacteroidia bacterium]